MTQTKSPKASAAKTAATDASPSASSGQQKRKRRNSSADRDPALPASSTTSKRTNSRGRASGKEHKRQQSSSAAIVAAALQTADRMALDDDSGQPAADGSSKSAYPPPQDIYHQQSNDAYPAPPDGQSAYPPPPESRSGDVGPYGHANGSYDPPLDPSIAPPQAEAERPYFNETHLAEALQRENRNFDSRNRRESYNDSSPGRQNDGADEDDDGSSFGAYGSNRDGLSAAQQESDRKRRKRVFSNRTKTGCLTCRRRKKKCDEQHPECNNCLRGGFVCEGYTVRNTWQKPATIAKPPVPLQSKGDYLGGGQTTPGAEYSAPPGAEGGEYPAPPQGEDTPSRAPYPGNDSEYGSGAQVSPTDSSRPGHEYDHRGSVAETDGGAYGAQSPTSHRGSWVANMSQGPEMPQTDGAAAIQEPVPAQPAGQASASNPEPPSQAQAAAQAALTHAAAHRPSLSNGDLTEEREPVAERERMLKGMYYYPGTPALIEDREQCIAAVWRFNHSIDPAQNIPPGDRIQLFRQIIALRPTPEPPLPNGESVGMPQQVFGSCGERVIVEAPFQCTYGYNITIGDDVLIGADCRITDTCQVTIGARTIISPGVKIICATHPIDPHRRQGASGPALGRNIVIEEDCWIGANTTILAGVKVGRCSTVGAGSLLHADVPKFTVVSGNPAKISRGIYDSPTET